MDKLCTVDEYLSDNIVFTAFGCNLHIWDELVADAFASLPEQEQSILILYCVLELTDGEIGCIAGMSRNAVKRHRTKTLNKLRKDLQSQGVKN
ncbi:MAG: sigma-70 family RNA polymerase sigma factor [Lachnospiraceae bacterium]|nr:sigma-70 family RNA polymerase sigma factor [Lachnospiraceae bacterium]